MKNKKYIQLPRGYLSYSQMVLWQSHPERYAKIYFDGRDELRHDNKGMAYGKVVADALEAGAQTDDLLTDAAMLILPKYDIMDKEIRTELPTSRGYIPLLGKPDSMDSSTFSFLEYKTGKNAWTQASAQKHSQLLFYATCIYLAHKVVPPSVKLVWIETEWVDDVVKPTGRVEEFSVNIGMEDILNMMVHITHVAWDIEVMYAAHVPDPRITNF